MPSDFNTARAITGKILASGQVAAATTNTTIYTVPAASAVKVATFSLTNITASIVTVTVSVVPSGGTVDGTHQVVSSYPLAANDSTTVSEVVGAMLDTGAFISINASAATAIDYLLTGAVAS